MDLEAWRSHKTAAIKASRLRWQVLLHATLLMEGQMCLVLLLGMTNRTLSDTLPITNYTLGITLRISVCF